MKDKIDEIINRIVKNINDYKNNYIKSEIEPKLKDGKIYILNNSYFSREESKDIFTKKSKKYLGFIMKDNLTEDDCFITEPINSFVKDIKEFNKLDNKKSLSEEVEEEIKNLGEIAFLIVSEYFDENSFSEKIDNKYFKKITFDPLASEPLKIYNDEIIIKKIDNCQEIFDKLKKQIEKDKFSEDLEKKIKKAIYKIKKESYYSVKISDKIKKGNKSILDVILDSIKENLEEYKKSISKGSDNDFNNVLRISYIFSYDVINLIKFLISMGDLKPLINWETFFTKYKFYESMKRLPGFSEENKFVIKKYIDIINKSRNKKFHRIFPFERKFEVKLSDNAIKEPVIIFFEQYKNNKEHEILGYKDKELIKLLQKFSITEEEIVQENFWEKNSEVIENAMFYISEFCDVLKELHEVYFSN